MTRLTSAVGYRAVLRLPGVPRAFTAAVLGRLSYATLSLSLLLVVQPATGSYLAAGAALGVFGLVSIVMPIKSRLIDRFGQRRTLPILSAGLAAALGAITACAAAGVLAEAPYVLLAAAGGLAAPPLGPSMRAIWAALTPDPDARQRAYSLDGVVEETLYAVGPLVVGVVVAVSGARPALIATAVLNLVGSIGMATARAAPAGHRAREHTDPAGARPGLLGPFRGPGFVLLAAAMVGIGLGTGPIDVSIVARAHTAGHADGAAYVLAGLSVGSAVGGLVWGHLTHRRATSIRLGLLVAAMAVGVVAAALSPTLVLLALVFALTGLVSAPVYITAYVAADALAPPGSRTEATTWVSTSSNLGISLGSAAAGLLVDRWGATSALLAGAVVLVITAAALLMTGPRLDRRPASVPAEQHG